MAKSITMILKQIEASKKRLAKERDKLRDLIEDAEMIKETCDEAYGSLDAAADALSKYL